MVNTLAKYRVRRDQLLYETRGASSKWTHIALYYDGDRQKQEIATFHNDKRHTVDQKARFTKLFPPEKCPLLWENGSLKPNIGIHGGRTELW